MIHLGWIFFLVAFGIYFFVPMENLKPVHLKAIRYLSIASIVLVVLDMVRIIITNL